MTKISTKDLWFRAILKDSVRTKEGHCISAKKMKLAHKNKAEKLRRPVLNSANPH